MKLNLVWFACFSVYFALSTFVDVRNSILSSITHTTPSAVFSTMLSLFFVIVVMIAIPSYGVGSLAATRAFVRKNVLHLCLTYAVVLVIALSAQFVMETVVTHPDLRILVGLFLLPVVSFLRVFFIVQVEGRHGLLQHS